MSSINATAGSPTQPTALICSGDNTATLVFQTNGSNAVVISSTQVANFTSTGAIKVSAGTTAQRPTGVNGMIRYNSNTSRLEGYVNSAWRVIV